MMEKRLALWPMTQIPAACDSTLRKEMFESS